MQMFKTIVFGFLATVLLCLVGCGGGANNSSTTSDPFASTPNTSTATQNNTIPNGTSSPIYGNIMFTDKAGLTPGNQSNMLEPWSKEGVDPTVVSSVYVLQLLPFKVTDVNGNPRVGVPITLSAYSVTSKNPDDVVIDFLVSPVSEPDERTITTDSAGMGIFNVAVRLKTPPIGGFTSSAVVFKATTHDPTPITAYVGGSYSLTATAPTTLAINPTTASFGTASDLSFTLNGGFKPFSVTSSDTSRVTVSLLSDGVTVIAHLADPSTWTGSVFITAADSAGAKISATVTR